MTEPQADGLGLVSSGGTRRLVNTLAGEGQLRWDTPDAPYGADASAGGG